MVGMLVIGGLVAVLAVFGLICVAHMIVEACFPLRQLMITVEVRTRQDAEILEMLLREARNTALGRYAKRLGVLLSADLCAGDEIPQGILQVLKQYGAECYLVEPENTVFSER